MTDDTLPEAEEPAFEGRRYFDGSEPNPGSGPAWIGEVRDATFRVTTEGGGVGSGVLIDDRIVATNAHVVCESVTYQLSSEDLKRDFSTLPGAWTLSGDSLTFYTRGGEIHLEGADGRSYLGKVISWRAGFPAGAGNLPPWPRTRFGIDAAFVELDATPARPVVRATGGGGTGDEVWCFGFPSSVARCEVVRGTVRVAPSPGDTWLRHSAPLSGGSSGGPVMDADGRLLGLSTFINLGAGHPNRTNLETNAVTADALYAYFDEVLAVRAAHPDIHACHFCGAPVPVGSHCGCGTAELLEELGAE